jgi:hypothetical protein
VQQLSFSLLLKPNNHLQQVLKYHHSQGLLVQQLSLSLLLQPNKHLQVLKYHHSQGLLV